MTNKNNARNNERNTRGNNFKGKRGPRKMSPSLEAAVKMVKPLRGRGKIFGLLSTNDRGDITEVGVYNGNTKRYALYRSELVDSETVGEFKEIMGSNSQ
jgi:hypothetical protein